MRGFELVRDGTNIGEERGWHCPDEVQLAAYADQNLSTLQRERIENHLAGCSLCRDLLGFLVKLQSEEVSEPVPVDWLVKARGLVISGKKFPRISIWAWSSAAAATACAILAVSLWFEPKPESSAAIPHSPAPAASSAAVVAHNEGAKPLDSAAPKAVVRNQTRTELIPKIIYPKANSIIAGEGIEFRWKQMNGALSYEARLLALDGDVLWEERVEAVSAKLPSTVTLRPHETYYLWIRAYFADGKVVQSKATRFTIADQN